MKMIDRVVRVECNFKQGLSEYGIDQALVWGEQPERGVYIVTDVFGEPSYYNLTGYTKNKKNATIFERENALARIKRLSFGPYLVDTD